MAATPAGSRWVSMTAVAASQAHISVSTRRRVTPIQVSAKTIR